MSKKAKSPKPKNPKFKQAGRASGTTVDSVTGEVISNKKLKARQKNNPSK